MNDNLRKEIIGHIEASGELACWITPYLYHAVYQTVKEMERDGTLVIEVGKRGEPVYVFAPADAPVATAAKVRASQLKVGDRVKAGYGVVTVAAVKPETHSVYKDTGKPFVRVHFDDGGGYSFVPNDVFDDTYFTLAIVASASSAMM